ncbi:MATH and UCH domain protein [Aspergillus luchuensis]|uniref:MATH and UCH domain protein n=1 Tax=Aspergillus kawachii TaxID=1069201 RepID=A0A146FU51_ASPKA|nr:MATH and UCH domain protein [Aspergillus luchuensis]
MLEETSDSHVVSDTRGRAFYLQNKKYGMIGVERSFLACNTRVLSYITRKPQEISNSVRENTAILCMWRLRLWSTDDQST